MKILNFGSLNIDYVYSVEHFVRPGETTSSTSLSVFCGGKGLNQSIALSRAGAEVYHAGGIGKSDGAMLKDILKMNNVSTDFVKEYEEKTGHAIIQVNQNGQNCILLFGGANQLNTKEYIDYVFENFDKGDYLVLQNEINELDYIIRKAHEKELIIVLNPSPMNDVILKLPLEMVDYFMLNEVEAADICPNTEKENLLSALSEKYPNSKIVLTLGKNGVQYKDKDIVLNHGIYKVKVVDTTAAGDTFTGFFIAEISAGKNPENALEIASKASSIAVSRKGAEPSIPLMNEVLNIKLESE